MTQIQTITVTLDTERSPLLEISLNDGTGDIPHQFTRTADAMWIEEYVNDDGYYTWHKFDTAEGAFEHVCQRWALDPADYPDAYEKCLFLDGDTGEEED